MVRVDIESEKPCGSGQGVDILADILQHSTLDQWAPQKPYGLSISVVAVAVVLTEGVPCNARC